MKFEPGGYYHVYNQGNNRQRLFHTNEDYHYFLALAKRNILPYCETLAYTLMPNHFHFLFRMDLRINNTVFQGGLKLNPVSNGFRKSLSGFTHTLNKRMGRSGSMFRQKTKSKLVATDPDYILMEESCKDYLKECFLYIHQNPLKAGLVKDLKDWEYSSYREYAGITDESICNQELAKKHFPSELMAIRKWCHGGTL